MTTRRWYSRDAQLLRLRTGARDPAVAISTLAENLLDEVGFDGPPFRPDILASFRGISDIRRHPMASAARLVPGDRGLIVEVNVDHSPSKQNFSIDHEITHTLLPTYSGQSVEDVVTGQFSLTSEEELLCDIGASTLLLDGRWLCPLARDAGPSLDTLFQLAETFGASTGDSPQTCRAKYLAMRLRDVGRGVSEKRARFRAADRPARVSSCRGTSPEAARRHPICVRILWSLHSHE